jgi:hypothetical protein
MCPESRAGGGAVGRAWGGSDSECEGGEIRSPPSASMQVTRRGETERDGLCVTTLERRGVDVSLCDSRG